MMYKIVLMTKLIKYYDKFTLAYTGKLTIT